MNFFFVARTCALASFFFAQAGFGQQGPAEKPVISKMLVANVYPNGYSEIYSLDAQSGYRAVSNITFTVFEPAVMIETADAIYDFFILCSRWSINDVVDEQRGGSVDTQGFPKHWPQQLPSRASVAGYLPIPGSSDPGASLQGEHQLLDLLHRYYQANRIQIEAQARQREIDEQRATAAAAAEAAQRAALPKYLGPPVWFKRLDYSPAASPSN